MTCSAAGKLLLATTVNSSEIPNSVDLGLADRVQYDHIQIDWYMGAWPLNSSLILFNNEDLQSKPKVDLNLIEKDYKTYVATNFSRPLAIEIKLNCPGREPNEIISLLLHRSHGTYSALVHFNGLNFIEAQTSSDSEHLLERHGETLRIDPLPSGASLEFELPGIACSYTYAPNRIRIISIPEFPAPHYQLVMLLDTVESLDSLTRFVQLELNNPTAKFVEDHLLTSVSRRENLEETTSWHAVEFESETPFSNETLQFIEDSCRSPYRWDGLFDVTDRETLNKMLGQETEDIQTKFSFSPFWNNEGCPVQTGLKGMKPDLQTSPPSIKIISTNLPSFQGQSKEELCESSEFIEFSGLAEGFLVFNGQELRWPYSSVKPR